MTLDQKSSTVQPFMCEGTNTVDQILSSKPLDEWRGSLTTFKGFTGTLPEKELIDASWDEATQLICPETPLLLTDKKQGQFFIACILKEAPLVGKTLEMALSTGAATVGKMRSKGHVTETTMLVIDIDGLSEAEFQAVLDRLKADGISYLVYSTFSHGNPAKPGVRARLVIPLNKAINVDDYYLAWHGFDIHYLGGQAGKADASGANLYQQQGTWCCDKTRQDQAFKLSNDAGVASADALMAIGRETQPAQNAPARVNQHNATSSDITTEYPQSDANKVADGCKQIGLFRDKKGAGQSEPVWHDCIGVVIYCKDGEELSQLWSCGHTGYSEADTARKLAYRKKFPPTTCNQFRKTNPEGCNGCTQTCNSPITLGWQVDKNKAIEGTAASNLDVACTSETLPEPVASATQHDDEVVIARLVGLKPMEYDRLRKEEAKALGIQLKTLDAMVKAARNEVVESGQLLFPVVEPYPDPVDPSQLLDEIVNVIRQFIVLDDEQADAAALWIAFTWFIEVVKVAPIAFINAPEKECGKTQMVDLFYSMSARPLAAANISTAVLFRTIEYHKPTLLIDEADTFIRENGEIKGLINAGHTRSNAFVLRVVGDNHEPKKFTVWGAKAFAGIALEKHLSDATMSRGIVINMRRRLKHELIKRFRHAEPGLFENIASKLARFANDYSQQVRLARPALPDALSDRAQDNWESLVAIAGCAGPEWEQRAITAALKLSSASESSVSIGNELLADIQQVFESKRVDKISTVDLIATLVDDDERPWATYNRGKPITPMQLAKLLNGYGIKSKTVRFKDGTPKGFDSAQFKDAFARYLATPESLPQQRNESLEAMDDEASGVVPDVAAKEEVQEFTSLDDF